MSKNSFGKFLLAISLTVASTLAAHANLIINGSFEQPTPFGPGGWALYSNPGDVPGWTPVNNYPIEIGYGGVYGVTGFVGNNVMEMDSTGNVMVDQIVGTPGGSYTLSLLYAQRAGVPPTSGSFEIWWNGSLLASVAPTTSAMTLFSTTVTGGALNTLEFRGTGTQDSYGAVIDDVQLSAVPEPSTYIAGALLMLPLGAHVLRRLHAKRNVA